MDYVDGKYIARTPEQMRELLQMATSGGPTSGGNVGLGMDSPIVAAASTFLPGAQPSLDISGGYMTSPDTRLTSGLGKYTPKPKMPATGNLGGRINDAGRAAINYVDDLVTPAAKRGNLALLNRLGGVGAGGKAGLLGHAARFAATPAALNLMKVGTGVGALGAVLGAADVLAGQDSAGNKLMDLGAMGIGGALGAVGGPMGIAAGAGIGKMVSDGAQFIFGGGKSAEQRKMEEALALLNAGRTI